MAKSKLPMIVLIVLVASILLLSSFKAEASKAAIDHVKAAIAAAKKGYRPINCAAKCDYRCSKASLHKRCLKYCNICCAKCKCVPPGTAGNREVCPCYNQLLNTKLGHKCP